MKKNKLTTLKEFLDEERKNPTFREAFEHYYETLSLGLKIQKLRKRANLSQKEFAAKLGVSQQLVSRIERGTTENPTLKTLHRIASVTGCQLKISFAGT